MRRFMVLIAGVWAVGLLFNGPEIAQAQTPRMDTIRLMAATQGYDYDFSSFLEWCVSTTWHLGYPGGPANALDELAQWGAGRDNCYSDPPPRTPRTEPVELLAYGLTDNLHTSCTLSSPCRSLWVKIRSGSTDPGQCNFIEAVLFEFTSSDAIHLGGTGEFKGRQRMLHATGPSNETTISVASGVCTKTG